MFQTKEQDKSPEIDLNETDKTFIWHRVKNNCHKDVHWGQDSDAQTDHFNEETKYLKVSNRIHRAEEYNN